MNTSNAIGYRGGLARSQNPDWESISYYDELDDLLTKSTLETDRSENLHATDNASSARIDPSFQEVEISPKISARRRSLELSQFDVVRALYGEITAFSNDDREYVATLKDDSDMTFEFEFEAEHLPYHQRNLLKVGLEVFVAAGDRWKGRTKTRETRILAVGYSVPEKMYHKKINEIVDDIDF